MRQVRRSVIKVAGIFFTVFGLMEKPRRDGIVRAESARTPEILESIPQTACLRVENAPVQKHAELVKPLLRRALVVVSRKARVFSRQVQSKPQREVRCALAAVAGERGFDKRNGLHIPALIKERLIHSPA
jgi:hypothetical protein